MAIMAFESRAVLCTPFVRRAPTAMLTRCPTRPLFIPRSHSSRPSPHRRRNLAVPSHALATPEPARLLAEALKLLTYSFFAKQFKLYRQLTERK